MYHPILLDVVFTYENVQPFQVRSHVPFFTRTYNMRLSESAWAFRVEWRSTWRPTGFMQANPWDS